jgi:hypothetical protein
MSAIYLGITAEVEVAVVIVVRRVGKVAEILLREDNARMQLERIVTTRSDPGRQMQNATEAQDKIQTTTTVRRVKI